MSLHKLVVVPVVAFLSDLSVLQALRPCSGEVDRIFDHPLEAILDPTISSRLDLAPKGSDHWLYHTDYHVSNVESISRVIFTVTLINDGTFRTLLTRTGYTGHLIECTVSAASHLL